MWVVMLAAYERCGFGCVCVFRRWGYFYISGAGCGGSACIEVYVVLGMERCMGGRGLSRFHIGCGYLVRVGRFGEGVGVGRILSCSA